MRRRLLTLLAACALPGCASTQRYEFAVFGDMPYVRDEPSRAANMPRYRQLLDDVGNSNAAFVVHVGDYTTGPFCGDSVVALRANEFRRFGRPLIFTFGDNDWTDCRRGHFDPLERLQNLRQVFTQGDQSLGRVTLPLQRQSTDPQYGKFRENVRWSFGNELYVALHIVGSRNNWGPDSGPSAEYVERNAANLAFLRATFDIAAREQRRGIGVFIQANPGLYSLPEDRTPAMMRGFSDFVNELQRLTVAFGKPVVLFHGDTHYFRVDKPLVDAAAHAIPNFTRVETFGDPNYAWVRVIVDPADPELFVFRLTGLKELQPPR
jgi:hypothetical protein